MKINKIFIIWVLFILILSFLSVFIFLNLKVVKTDNFKNFFEDTINRISKPKNSIIESDEVIPNNFINFGSDVAVISKSKFMILSPSLQKLLEINHNFRFPVVKNSDFKALIFDADGKDYIITTKSKILNKNSIENKIITGKISDRENLVLITESDEYCCELRVLSVNNKDIYKYCFAQMYVTDVAINDSGDKVAICGLKSEEGVTKSVIQVFDFKHEKPIFSKEFENNIFSFIEFFDDNDFAVIGDNLVLNIKNLGENIQEFNYNGKILCLHSFNKKSGVALSFSPTNDERNQYVIIFNKSGKHTNKIETEKRLKSIALYNNKILAVSESQIFILKPNGKILHQKKIPLSSQKALLASGLKAYILGKGEVLTKKI